jgi:phosphoserine phosphatase
MKMAKKIKTLILDGDGTTWHYPINRSHFGSSWDALSYAYDMGQEAELLLEYYYTKPELYWEWTGAQAALFTDRECAVAERKMWPIPYNPGLKELALKARGLMRRGIISTGLDICARKAAEELDLDFCFCNTLLRRNGRFSGEVLNSVPLWEKLRVMKTFLSALNLDPKQACYVGDSKGDIPCMKVAGLAVAFNPKDQETRGAADLVISDFRALIKYMNLN